MTNPTPKQLAMARRIADDGEVSGTVEWNAMFHGALAAIIETSERAAKFLFSEAIERAKDECPRDAEVITECATAIRKGDHLDD